MSKISNNHWQKLETFVEIRNKWVTFIGERFKDENGQHLDYWRVEKADSVIVLPMFRNFLVLPPPYFRPGINTCTYDFPGGRVLPGKLPIEMVPLIIKKEVDIDCDKILSIHQINDNGYFINSSFSNQKLYGFSVEIDHSLPLMERTELLKINMNNPKEIQDLLNKLHCLQCRALLLEHLYKIEHGNILKK
jgi:hypothetical protein